MIVTSLVMLLLEMALIRWISTESRIFAYVNNLVLLACFLGIGAGCYYSNKKIDLAYSLYALTLLITFMLLPIHIKFEGKLLHIFKDIPWLLSAFSDSVIWIHSKESHLLIKSILGISATLILFALIMMVFFPLGQLLGSLFSQSKNIISAYSLNVFASLIGIWCFDALSFMYQPPWVWFLLAWVSIAWLILRFKIGGRFSVISLWPCLLSVLIMMAVPLINNSLTIWSPYQKLDVTVLNPKYPNRGYGIDTNNTFYLVLLNLSKEYCNRYPFLYGSQEDRDLWQYEIPYTFKPHPKDVLIVGAGGGNDVASAIRNGVSSVTAVEIDPGIYKLGLDLHPEKPYSDKRVDVVINDARTFFKHSNKKYDLIVFGLLDSHILSSSYNNTRIDNYVYTLESFKEARALLKKGGIITVTFIPNRRWIGNRIYFLLKQVFGKEPVAFGLNASVGGWAGVFYVVSDDMDGIRAKIENNEKLKKLVEENTFIVNPGVRLSTDDWPYLYLEKPQIPKMHLSFSILILAMLLLSKKLFIPKGEKLNLHFFFLGAAFLLLEFQNISKTTLLFGSTWLVNSFTISAILILILGANLIAQKTKSINIKLIYAGLIASIGAIYFFPLSYFNSFPFLASLIASSILLNLPILFAGIIFANSFKNASSPNQALGSNIFGACVGGLLEALSFVGGIRFLILLVLILYWFSFKYFPLRNPS
jgi:spermidine synthase